MICPICGSHYAANTLHACSGGGSIPTFTLTNEPTPAMSPRDWFAGLAMQGLLRSVRFCNRNGDVEWDGHLEPEAVVLHAYRLADAMIRAREGKPDRPKFPPSVEEKA